ncbi:MAG: class I SAM-dependent DNA methyltransferase [Sphingomonadaceae bacterium]|nr:class I SAM-dependent DNA methyltransferase [Sphingomonadaceae bacterium]
MNAVEIEEAVSALAERPFDAAEFPFQFLEAFGSKATTIKRLRAVKGSTNASDLPGAVLQRNNIHIAVAAPGEVSAAFAALKVSPATAKAKAKFILSTDGDTFEAEDTDSGETVACTFVEFPDHFGFFLPLAGITTVRQVRESSFDIRATSRLNRLYVELLKDNPEWGSAERRPDMNHFMARLIFCFFAEDTDIFHRSYPFTGTIEKMSDRDSSNTHEVIGELFRAMNTRKEDHEAANIRNWARPFPYVNGGLFSGSLDVPRFSRIARSYLLHIGSLDWTKINPDIFGSMIQAVADDEERGALGMHYTSVPNILKVLNPLFLDDLRAHLAEADDNPRKLLNLRNRMAKIRVFDPACGSGNFLVIAYKEMRAIEAEINRRRGEEGRASDIPLTNFRGIELRDFPAEIARLALIIAEFQCDVMYRGERLALAEFLPLNAQNWITCGNALRLDWLSICPPTGTGVKLTGDDLFSTPLDQAQIDFENEGGETYICGNPPYLGSSWQSPEQKREIEDVCAGRVKTWKSLDYVAAWLIKASDYLQKTFGAFGLVATKTVCEGEQVPALWPVIYNNGHDIIFAHTRFDWSNLASNQAGVTVAILGVGPDKSPKKIYDLTSVKIVENITPYLTPGDRVIVSKSPSDLFRKPKMLRGNMPTDGGNLILSPEDARSFISTGIIPAEFVRPFVGADELTSGKRRFCLWIEREKLSQAMANDFLSERISQVDKFRKSSSAPTTRNTKVPPYRFMQIEGVSTSHSIAVGAITTDRREFLPASLFGPDEIFSNKCYVLYDAELWTLALLVSTLHRVWIGTVSARMRMGFSYTNTLGWNTFPLPITGLTEKNRDDLTRCAEDILVAREAHFPATIADLYDPETMPADLREAHERNDEVLERIYIGRRFRNDTERLEKLFELYTKMTAGTGAARKRRAGAST